MSVTILPANSILAVEVAWGADLTASDTTWTWTDVTTDVRQDPGISTNIGRNDEASATQPASCTMELNNTAGLYTIGPQNTVNYPYVRRGTPVRVRVNANSAGFKTVFFGYAVGWTPGWDVSGRIRTVKLEVAGSMRRLLQGTSPVKSPMRRYLETTAGSVVAYWSCEDGKQATSFAPSIGSNLITWSGTPSLATSSAFVCSYPLPSMKDARYSGAVTPFTPNATDGSMSIRCLYAFPTSGVVDGTVLLRVYTSGTVARWDLVYATGSGGMLAIKAYNQVGTLVSDSGNYLMLVDGNLRRLSMEMYQSGGNVYYGLNSQQVGESSYVSFSGILAVAGTVGIATQVEVNPNTNTSDIPFGHLSVQALRSATESLSAATAPLNAFVGERPFQRFTRLCAENNVPAIYFGTSDIVFATPADTLGYQQTGSIIPLLRDVEVASDGLLYDGLTAGLVYRTRQNRESKAPAAVFNVNQLSGSFQPVDDDQRLTNRATVSKVGGGGEYTFTDAAGPLGSDVVGVYDTSLQVNVRDDVACEDISGWLVSKGTVVGYRYPQITVNLRDPAVAQAWILLEPGLRVDITNVGSVLPGHPNVTISLVIEGISNQIRGGDWVGTLKCSPYQVWDNGTLGNTTVAGDVAGVIRADATSTTGTAITSVSTSISVVTTSSGPWITTAGFSTEFPFDVEIRGQRVTVTAISGTSPQTFTINASGVVGTIPSGSPLQLWRPTLIGL